MKQLILIYFRACPNSDKVKETIREAGLDFKAVEQDDLDRDDPFLNYSSPSILLDGTILFGAKTDSKTGSCSIHLPSVQELSSAFFAQISS